MRQISLGLGVQGLGFRVVHGSCMSVRILLKAGHDTASVSVILNSPIPNLETFWVLII